MNQSTPLTPAPRESAFSVPASDSDAHIVDTLIEERCPNLRASWSWPVARPVLYTLLGYRKARRMADRVVEMSGREAFDYLADELQVQVTIRGSEHIPKKGAVIIAANHPTGLADGIAVWDMLSKIRQDIIFFANADAVRVNPNFSDVIIPVEWVMEKRSPAKTRETLRLAGEAFAAGKCVVIFPSGRLAARLDGKLKEKEWFSTVVGLARKKKSNIVPLNVNAKNSELFYLLSEFNPELRDITLFHELLNKRNAKFDMTAGEAIPHETFSGDSTSLTEQLRKFVAYQLKDDPGAVFDPQY